MTLNSAVLTAIENERNSRAKLGRALEPCVAEIVGARLMLRLGIGAPADFRLADSAEALPGNEWVCKTLERNRLKFGRGASKTLLIRKIPHAISLYSLREIYGISSPVISIPEKTRFVASDWEYLTKATHAVTVGHETLPNAREFFSDFVLPRDTTALQNAIRWNSFEMLKIHSARLFLGCSTAHSGNILVDSTGKLFSVDHENVVSTNSRELVTLFKYTKRKTSAWDALASVASLEADAIETLFADFPAEHMPGCHRESKYAVVEYFLDRLELWKRCIE